MHQRVWSEGEGRSSSPELSISCHMRSAVIPADSDSFFRDGREICVGDCALFKLSNKSPPCIGLIRWLALNKENNLQLGVNWLYRSSDLKLGKFIWVDIAPNEIFYSFQKKEIPAASLLHPCKVVFLPRSVELPTGISSFVCRRAYDIANKSLGWLTDQHYINDQQEEVDQLLHKTRTEMHMTLQSGCRSPKNANGPISTSQLKASDSGQNSGSSFHSQTRGKKRERSDHGADSVKRERSARLDDGDSVQSKPENNLKYEIARITENGGVVDLEGVEKLVQLMQPDKERKLDLVSCSMLASVMASIEKVDCLTRFVQLRGLPVLDEWLRDIHKGKIGDGSNKSVDEFLLVLLRALDKLPVNLQALQMCNIGRSVNHLRSHRNTDIQRRARSLVDSWKKRVEAEMISIDAKSGSTQAVSAWSSKSGPTIEGNTHKLTVKIANRAKSSAQCISVGSLEDPTTMGNQASSPTLLNKHEQSNRALKDKSPTSRSNVGPDMNEWKNNDPKDGSECAESPAVLHDKEQSMTVEDSKRVIEGPPIRQSRPVNLHTSSISPMNALIESCVKYSEATLSSSLEDDDGMNLLASVAAGEISRSVVVSPADSTERSKRRVEELCTGDEVSSPEDCSTGVHNHLHYGGELDDKKLAGLDSCSADGKFVKSHPSKDGDGSKDFDSSGMNLGSKVDTREVSEKSDEKTCTASKEDPLSERLDKEVGINAAGESNGKAVPCSTSLALNVDCKEASPNEQEIPGHISPQESQCPGSVVHETINFELSGSKSDNIQAEEDIAVFASVAGATDISSRMKFDLNKGFGTDDGKCDVLPVSATSAFRPAEPRKAVETTVAPLSLSCHDASTNKNSRFPLDIDLNIPDERVLEEMASRGSGLAVESTTDLPSNCATLLDLDLNLVDEANDTGHLSTSSNYRGEVPIMHVRPASSFHIQRDFDLNNGPDGSASAHFSINQPGKGVAYSQHPSASGLTVNNPGLSSFSSWFPPRNTFSNPSILPDPVIPPGAFQRAFTPTSFNPAIYRGSILSSSSVPFPSGSFQFPTFPFGTTFPLPSSYPDSSPGARPFSPTVNSQYLSQQLQRPYILGIPDTNNNDSRKWGRPGLDLNTGPVTLESDSKEMFSLSSGPNSVPSLQALTEEQALMFSSSSGILKRKESEGGGPEKEPFIHKHYSWK